MKALVISLLCFACSSPWIDYAPNGDPSYQRATLCASAEAAPFVRDAAERWHAASERVAIAVRVVSDAEEPQEGCDTNVYFTDIGRVCDGYEVEHCGAMGGHGLIAIDDGLRGDADLSDIVTHEVGHLLLGDSHNSDDASVMFWRTQDGEQDITAADVSLLP